MPDQDSGGLGVTNIAPAIRLRPIVFLSGAFFQYGQVLIFREIMSLTHGAELLFGVTLGVWLVWAAAGAALGGYLAGRRPEVISVGLLRSGLFLAGTLAAAQILSLRLINWSPGLAAGQMMPLSRAVWPAWWGPGALAFLSGLIFSLALRLAPESEAGSLYRTEAWGAAAGGLAAVLILAILGSPIRQALIAGAALAGASFFLVKPFLRPGWPALAGLIGLILTLAGAIGPWDAWSEKASWTRRLAGYELEQSLDTNYGRLTVVKRAATGQAAVFQNGGLIGHVEASGPDRMKDLAALLAAQHPAPRQVLLIGGALSRLPAVLLDHGLERLDLVELDPAVIELSRNFNLWPATDRRLRAAAADGREVVRRAPPAEWDLVLVMSPGPDNVAANRYLTREFFSEVRRVLQPGGVLGLTLPAYGASSEYTGPALAARTAAVLAALKQVFAHTLAAPAAGHVLLAAEAPGLITWDPEVLAGRLAGRPKARPVIETLKDGRVERLSLPDQALPLYYESLFGGVLAGEREGVASGPPRRPALDHFTESLEAVSVQVNEDDRPSAVLYSLAAAGHLTGSGEGGFRYLDLTQWLDRRLAVLVLAAGLALIALTALADRLRDRFRPGTAGGLGLKFGVGLTALAAGAWALSQETALLLVYQNLSGQVYLEVGLLTAVFMVGLAGGAGLAEARSGRLRDYVGLAVLTMVLLSLTSPIIIKLASAWSGRMAARALTTALLLSAGLVQGAAFLWLVRLVRRPGQNRPAAWVYAADLAGAALAAPIVSAGLIPLLGVASSLGLAGLPAAAAWLGVILVNRRIMENP
ncbi:MAG: hypothetical protein AB1641_24205 [Thermodesulfobacteriota bacterium]